MAKRVETPIKSCHDCWRNYTLSEWKDLELVAKDGTLETKHCACGEELTLDRDGLEDLDLTDDPNDYETHHAGAVVQPSRVVEANISKPKPTPASSSSSSSSSSNPITRNIVAASYRRSAPGIKEGVRRWLQMVPHQADAFTLGELRELMNRP